MTIQGQAQESLVRKADRLYAQYAFAEAIVLYEQAFELGADDHEAARKLADSYRRVRDLSSSEKWYALLADSPEATSQDLYYYADALRTNAKYALADSIMNVYGRLDSLDSRTVRLSHVSELYPWLLVDPYFEGELETLAWNSGELDMAPAFWQDKMVFASNRTPQISIHRNHAWDGHPFLNLYQLEDTTAVLMKGTINTKYHESNATFNAKGDVMFFTRNSYLDGKSEKGADGFANLMIYGSTFSNGKWSEEVSFPFNLPDHSTGHPSLSDNGRTLYFSSDRSGGFGGVDIWRTEQGDDGQWSEPVNMGPVINTEGNEMFPSVHGNGALFFSSDGHAGLGGMDVFLSYDRADGPTPPVNVGAPVNSRSDDMSLVLTSDGSKGYFSSDRANGMGEADIYGIRLERPFKGKVLVHGRLVDENGGAPLANIPVCILRPDRTLLAKELTRNDGTFEFAVEPQSIVLLGGIPGGSEMELPMDEHLLLVDEEEIFLKDIPLATKVNVPLIVRVIDERTGLPASNLTIRVIDRTRGDQVIAEGLSNKMGAVSGMLPEAVVGRSYDLAITIIDPDGRVAERTMPFHVQDGKERVLEQYYDMGNALLGEARERQQRVFTFLSSETAEDGSVWSGYVIDRNDRSPIPDVPVVLLDIRRNELARTVTAADGSYSLRSTSVAGSVIAAIPGGDHVEMNSISPFGDERLPALEVDGVMDLPVNAILTDITTGAPIEGVVVTVSDKKSGTRLFRGVTDPNGISQGTIPDRRFGSDEHFEVVFEKEGYLPLAVDVDISVLAFLEQALGGPEGFRMIPNMLGLDIGRTMHLRPILFDYNDATIRSDASGELDLLARIMQLEPSIRIELRSHTDSRGSGAFNQFLSVRRAESTKAYLVGSGIAPSRIVAVGMGERQLVNHCKDLVTCSEVEHQANRRTEFIVISDPKAEMAQAPR